MNDDKELIKALAELFGAFGTPDKCSCGKPDCEVNKALELLAAPPSLPENVIAVDFFNRRRVK